jgi:hypothetical protein
VGSAGPVSLRAKGVIAMPWSVPTIQSGRVSHGPQSEAPLSDNSASLTTDEPTGFSTPKPRVSAFDLARRMRAKALSLDWEDDEYRERLLLRARELETGDSAEVTDEDF